MALLGATVQHFIEPRFFGQPRPTSTRTDVGCAETGSLSDAVPFSSTTRLSSSLPPAENAYAATSGRLSAAERSTSSALTTTSTVLVFSFFAITLSVGWNADGI